MLSFVQLYYRFLRAFCSSSHSHHHLLSSESHPDVIGADRLVSAEGYQSDLAFIHQKLYIHQRSESHKNSNRLCFFYRLMLEQI